MSVLANWFGVSGAERRLQQQLARIERNQILHMATVKERLETIETHIDEGTAEVLAEIAALREAIANGNPAQIEEVLARLETKATTLKDIIPNAPPVEPPA